MEDKFLTEGILNQFVKTISEDIPILLASLCKDYFCIDDEVTKIVEDHLLERIYLTDSTYYEKIKTPEQNVMKALEKKRRYQLKRLFEDLDHDQEKALSGNPTTSLGSPYSQFTLMIMCDATGMTTAESVEIIASKIEAFRKLVSDQDYGKKSQTQIEFHGFYEYPYFTLLSADNRRKAEKFLRIDLEEFILCCSTSPKYNQYVSYPADSVGRGFYGEVIRSKKEDTEYEVVTSQYLRDTFFPDEQGINHVKILSKKPWDLKDMDLFGYLCTKGVTELLRSGIGGKPTLEVKGTIRELCKVVSPEAKSYGQKSYTLVQARLGNMIDTKLEAITADGRQIIQQLFDRVIIDNPAHQKTETSKREKQGGYYTLRIGWSLTEDILSHRLSTVIKARISELKNPVSVILYAPLKKDRAVDLCMCNRNSHEYSIIDLMLLYRLDARRKATRIEKFSEVFEEMKSKKLLIKDYTVVNSKFIITWMPLSLEEKNDIRVLQKGSDAVIDVTATETPIETEKKIKNKKAT